ncbi:alpha-amylase [candidate division KSB1 bacterium]|nr:alpha-amylase [candidate division KSB1 bacterium]
MEFHISRKSRDTYQFDELLYSITGNVVFSDFMAVRTFVQKVNDRRNVVEFPELAWRAGDVNAMGLIDEILHRVLALYREEINPKLMTEALTSIETVIGKDAVDKTLRQFVETFPPIQIFQSKITIDDYLSGETDGQSNPEVVLEEMLLLWLANGNPAFTPYSELFDDTLLKKKTSYLKIMESLEQVFNSESPFGSSNQQLIQMLRSPMEASPYSLDGQLEYIREHWGKLIGKILYKLLSSLDLLEEERKLGFTGPGPSAVYDYSSLDPDYERFSEDKDWMPRVVMMAKNTYVWLDQLSKKYETEIHRLDQIPDEELDLFAGWGFTSLWLIGLWERSKASKTIKQMCGNPDAEASAYSLMAYTISSDLGGEGAFQNLRDRAWQRGIRMGGDMVPNHVGIDGKWVMEHPDWFVSLDHCPYPSYTFNGSNLSIDDRVGIYLEDHYYERSDAAVVFKRVDHWTGSEKYIYHGNDGTSMPWNDTAQLNYLNPEAREAVIQTILHVARQFPVIRFDAAMTLAKKHIQRLWFPEPGSGGAIPSRSEHALSRVDFEKAIPNEFWREVVDRVAQEAPDTLLLAEAFWMLEGYFVRTLGMHRVYNSAFMNMLKNEENEKYRSVIKNTIQFDPEILKRYVNFMNNPDEDTAVAQFGKEDKYFGVCVLLSTMPGLPMFGHGQIEGYTEKYGMEFRRAYWDEQPNSWLVERHEREIFPILRKRYLFAHVHNFLLYDFFAAEGHVDENVFAYSNQAGDERALVIYNNVYGEARGWIKTSAAYIMKEGDQKNLTQKSLGEGLALFVDPDTFCVFRDQISGLQYIRSSKDLHESGMYFELNAFQYHVFLDFYEVQDQPERPYSQLSHYLNGRGVPDVEEALREIFLQPLHGVFQSLINPEILKKVLNAQDPKRIDALFKEIRISLAHIIEGIQSFIGASDSPEHLLDQVCHDLAILLRFPNLESHYTVLQKSTFKIVKEALIALSRNLDQMTGILFYWIIIRRLGVIKDPEDQGPISRCWIDELMLGKLIDNVLTESGFDEDVVWRAGKLLRILTQHQDWIDLSSQNEWTAQRLVETLLGDHDVRQLIKVNRHRDVLWFQKEAFEEMMHWLITARLLVILSDEKISGSNEQKSIRQLNVLFREIEKAKTKSGYQVEKLLDLL